MSTLITDLLVALTEVHRLALTIGAHDEAPTSPASSTPSAPPPESTEDRRRNTRPNRSNSSGHRIR
ncbi:hypothetical protein [Nocardiopsis sp. HUAS JQ3]|uniref:hypothetical protein n=1 Tax=Nocardiopsis sp. HUAS JQ3 TaxID=3061629 RepID=UPI0023A92AE8|nr:hypothetical protein [Nocardiopsis sp. HUAS JQ3]WDZ90004.1 hypothetical protein PV789_24345 [Nocardiopsis sp. HUAS JQ3]